ncbi:hypothetical protein CEE69_29600 [Rhodopirellula bahusiensis]|uniref:Uncharacterized protein n=1 Tax=Rhodopirellula bahusiensis TaxID=2014065 RepID=A0A2G1VY57_9BACT|nr:hypothetical protein CEE69_29600 [Rhodopirellula bahusiensis]
MPLASMKLAVGQSTALAKGQTQHSQRATPLVLPRATRTLWPTAKFILVTPKRIARQTQSHSV